MLFRSLRSFFKTAGNASLSRQRRKTTVVDAKVQSAVGKKHFAVDLTATGRRIAAAAAAAHTRDETHSAPRALMNKIHAYLSFWRSNELAASNSTCAYVSHITRACQY